MASSSAVTGAGGAVPGVLRLHRVLGISGSVSQAVHYIEEGKIGYVGGNQIVLYQPENKRQTFLSTGTAIPPPVAAGTAGIDAAAAAASSLAAAGMANGEITALAVCHLTSVANTNATTGKQNVLSATGEAPRSSKSKLLAVAERGDGPGRAVVNIFSMSSHKKLNKLPLMCSEVASSEIVWMNFSPDGKHLLIMYGGPDWMLVCIAWEKGKILAIAKVSNQSGAVIHSVSFCPTDPSVVCVTGNGILRFLHLEQGEFKSIPFSMGKREPQNYLSHAWIDDRILVGTDSGDILVFENAEFRGVLESSPAGGKSIDAIAAYSKGFVLGMDEGYLMIFERDDKEIYKYSRSFQIDGNFVKIKSLAISPSEEHVVAVLENNQAYTLGLAHHAGSSAAAAAAAAAAAGADGRSGAAAASASADELAFEPLVAWHHMSITGMDVCIRKPLVVTCGADRSVRLYNLLHDSVEVTRFFNEQPHSCALHPQGLLLLVGFSDSLRLLNILMDDVQPFRDFAIKACKEVQFSNGGQYFAAANGSVIQVFATYTCEMLGSFNVHKAKVRSIAWSADDSALISAGMDGCVFSTKISTGEHTPLAKHKCNYTSAVQTADGKVYAAGSDRHLKVISDGALQSELNCGTLITQLAVQLPRAGGVKDRFLYAGLESGAVRVFPIPVEGKCYDQQVHCGPVTRIRATPDDLWVVTASEDGSLAIFAVDGKRDGAPGTNKAGAPGRHGQPSDQVAFSEEVLASAEELRERYAMVADMQSQVTELKERIDATLRLKDAAFKEKLRETSERFNSELEGDKTRYAELEATKASLETSYAQKVDQLSALHRAKMRELQEHHDHKMQQEDERRIDFESRIKAQRAACEAELAELDEKCIAEKNALADEYESKIAEARALKVKLLLEREQVRLDMEEEVKVMDAVADAETGEIREAKEQQVAAIRKETLGLKDENSIQKRKFGNVREDITENLDDLQRMRDKHAALYEQIDSLEKDIKGHVKEIREREATIADKRYRIFELQKKNQELEKFKFVLDYKIAELKRQIAPRKSEMAALSAQIIEMERELRGYKKESADLRLDVTELHLKGDGMDAAIAKETAAREEIAAHLSHVKTELHEVFQEIDHPKKLKDGMIRLYQRHVQNATQQREQAVKARAKEKENAAAVAAAAVAGGSAGSANGVVAAGSGPLGPGPVDDVHHDYQRQRHYLERSIDSHNAKCKKDMRVHIKEHTRIMQENIALTKEVNELRREKYHILVQQKSKDQAKAGKGAGPSPPAGSPSSDGRGGRLSRTLGAGGAAGELESSSADETEIQQEQIRALKKQLAMLDAEYAELINGGAATHGSNAAAPFGQLMASNTNSGSISIGSSSARSNIAAAVLTGQTSARSLHGADKLPQLPEFARGYSGSASQRLLQAADRDGDADKAADSGLQAFDSRKEVEQKEISEHS